jgi:hypothetical protein
MTNEEQRQIRLECLRLSGGNIPRAREMYDFIIGIATTGQFQQHAQNAQNALYNHGYSPSITGTNGGQT